ncbi:MAG: EAL domain-containing protein [Sulfurimonas sp.]|nr:EAL domain-containing protein [Sulfurimonas sp.]
MNRSSKQICFNKVIAEFVHSREVQAKVEELGVDYSQGYYFGEPKEELQ